MNRRVSETVAVVLVSLVIVMGSVGIGSAGEVTVESVSYTHLRAHET